MIWVKWLLVAAWIAVSLFWFLVMLNSAILHWPCRSFVLQCDSNALTFFGQLLMYTLGPPLLMGLGVFHLCRSIEKLG
jgi:hypothetical protein